MWNSSAVPSKYMQRVSIDSEVILYKLLFQHDTRIWRKSHVMSGRQQAGSRLLIKWVAGVVAQPRDW